MSIQKDLEENAREYFNNGLITQNKKEYNSSVTLFFKSISTLADLFILKNEGSFPSSHAERFRILEKNYKEIYELIDKNFPYYQNTYRNKLNKETSKMLENDARKLFKTLGIRI